MSFWLGLSIAVVGLGVLVGFGLVDRAVRWLLPESHWRKLQEKGAEVRSHGEEELALRKAQVGAQWGVVERVTGTGDAPAWVLILWGVGLLATGLGVAWLFGSWVGWW